MSDGATRLIIKELPKDADEATLIKHIKARCGEQVANELTDCRIIRHGGKSRRIAFVGFKTSATAKTCQQQADKTYIRTSRLQVALALKEGDSKIPREWSKITKERTSSDKENAEEDASNISHIKDTGRLMILNIPYETTIEDLQGLMSSFGKIVDIKIPKKLKGVAYVTYAFAPAAVKAYVELQNSQFMGRKIRCKAADDSADANPVDRVLSAYTVKSAAKKAILEKKLKRNMETQSWNLLYVSASVATEVVAKQLGVEVEDIVGADNAIAGDSIAARVAVAESFVVSETKKWLTTLGLPETVFIGRGANLLGAKLQESCSEQSSDSQAQELSKQTLFIKHLGPWVEDGEELRKLLGRFGHIEYFGLAPTSTIAIVSYTSASEAQRTFTELALYNFHSKPLYLEFAPAIVDEKLRDSGVIGAAKNDQLNILEILEAKDEQDASFTSSTIYITNLSFKTTESQLEEIFKKYPGFRKVSLLRSKKRVRDMSTGVSSEVASSLGHGFVIFDTSEQAQTAMKENLNLIIDGHAVQMDWSRSKESREMKKPRLEPTAITPTSRKVIVKNLDFTATAKDLKELFRTYGTVLSCRLPKRSDGRIRGFGFVEFATAADAQQAVSFLKDVRLFGRRLVIQSVDSEEDPPSSQKAEEQTAS